MPKPISSLLIALLLLAQCCLQGQTTWQYSPIKDDEAKLKSLQSEIRKQYEKDSVGVTGENKKYVLEIYRSRFKSLDELFTDKETITSPEASAYINTIANEIISKNPELKKIQPRVFFSRAWWPNAYTTGEGTVVFNIDLFIKLQNESQVAFVMCHELAHQYLEHSNKKINKYINTIYSKEFQEKLKELRKQKYGKKDELDELEKSFAFNIFRHSREYETEADSIGLHFMKNTGYDCKEALSCLTLLDEMDEEKMDYSQQLPKVFNFSEYPFRKR